ncbi:hypothetical protein FHG87_021180, partial [Trinorchestia longiramus]
GTLEKGTQEKGTQEKGTQEKGVQKKGTQEKGTLEKGCLGSCVTDEEVGKGVLVEYGGETVWMMQEWAEAGEAEAGEVEAGEVEAGEVEAGEVEAGEAERRLQNSTPAPAASPGIPEEANFQVNADSATHGQNIYLATLA